MAPIALAIASCGGDYSNDDGSDDTSGTVTVAITSSGLSTKEISLGSGESLRFENQDSVAHQIASNPHPTHSDCSEMNGPSLSPGDGFTVTGAATARDCGFHDHLNAEDARFQGVVHMAGGGGTQNPQNGTPSTPTY
jgi:hypothetical protein